MNVRQVSNERDMGFYLEFTLTILKRLTCLMSASLLAKETPWIFGACFDYSKETYILKVCIATCDRDLSQAWENALLSIGIRLYFSTSTLIQVLDVSSIMCLQGVLKILQVLFIGLRWASYVVDIEFQIFQQIFFKIYFIFYLLFKLTVSFHCEFATGC